MITLGTLALPDGLRWTDEFAWSPVAQSTASSLTGALLIQEGTRSAGRPLTLTGGRNWAWMNRTELLALQTLLDTQTDGLTLALHDGRQIPVIPARDGDGPLSASPVPVVRDSAPADPSSGTNYYIDAIRFLIVGDIVEPAP
jgi:hypothetical protein